MANYEHAKGAREWPTGGAGRPGLVAILGGPFAQVQARSTLSPMRVFWKITKAPSLEQNRLSLNLCKRATKDGHRPMPAGLS